jgi:hypothetical protein
MTKIDEIMLFVAENYAVTEVGATDKLRATLEAALKPGEPVMIYHGRCIIDCGEHGAHDVEMLKMIPKGAKLYTAPPAQTPPRLTDADFERITGEEIALSYDGDVQTWRAVERAVRKQFGVNDE